MLVPAFLLSVSPVLACGPWFPNNMLDRGDAAVLAAPVANFYHELDRMQIATPQFTRHGRTIDQQLFRRNIADRTRRLARRFAKIRQVHQRYRTDRHRSSRRANQVATVHRRLRELESARVPIPEWRIHTDSQRAGATRPMFPSINIVDGLPGEFADYFEGAIAWNSPSGNKSCGARESWELMNRPLSERHYKSTWAAFMLGRSWESEDPQKARDYYKQVHPRRSGIFRPDRGVWPLPPSDGKPASPCARMNSKPPSISTCNNTLRTAGVRASRYKSPSVAPSRRDRKP